jgi:hypothetical protein
MQRRSTRTATKNNLNVTTPSCEKLNSNERQDDYEYIYLENSSKNTRVDWISLIKLFGVIILLLPYLLIISSKLKESNVLPKLKGLLEDSFTCPDINLICNNTQFSTPASSSSETKNKDL